MNQFSLQSAKVVTALTPKGWSQIHAFSPDQPAKRASHGQLLAVITLANVEPQQAAAFGREALARLHEEYFGRETAESPLVKLKKAVATVAAEANGNRLSVIAVVLAGEVLYLAVLGDGRIVLRRGNQSAMILAGNPGQPVQAASGFAQRRDYLLLGSADFFQLVDQKIIDQALASGNLEEATEILAPLTREGDGTSLVTAAIALVGQMAPADETETVRQAILPKVRLGLPKLKNPLASLRRKVFQVSWRAFYLQLQARPKEKSRRMMFTVALTLLAVLIASVFLGQQKLKTTQTTETVTVLASQIQESLDEGESLLGLNPVAAKQLILQAQELLNQAEASGLADSQLSSLKARLATLLPLVVREYEVNPETFFDLGLIRSEASVTDATLVDDHQMLILDAGSKAIYQVNLENKQQAVTAGGSGLEKANQIVINGGETFVATAEEVLLVTSSKNISSVAKLPGPVKDLQAFGGNLYYLSNQGIEFLAALPAGGFAEPQAWLKGGRTLSQPVSMAIDGSIWVLQADGEILKFTRGMPETFGIAGLDKPLLSPSLIFTDENQENLYILDQGNQRLVVLEKSGEYHTQYHWEGFGQASGMVVAEKAGRISVLTQNKIYHLEIK